MNSFKQGAVVEYPAIFSFETYPRPYVLVSNESHPFSGEEYIGLAITTTQWNSAIRIVDEAWAQGELPKQSYIKPWQPALLKHDDITNAFGLLTSRILDRAVSDLEKYVGTTRESVQG